MLQKEKQSNYLFVFQKRKNQYNSTIFFKKKQANQVIFFGESDIILKDLSLLYGRGVFLDNEESPSNVEQGAW